MQDWPTARDHRGDLDDEAVLADGRRPDPGSPQARTVAWLLLIPLLAAIIFLQHGQPPPPPPESVVTPPTSVEPFTLVSKLQIKLWHASRQTGQSDPALPAQLMQNLDNSAQAPLERIRAAMVAGEMLGPAEARTRLAKSEEELAQLAPRDGPGQPGYSAEDLELMRESVRKLQALYQGGGEAALPEEDQRFLVDHHGWFGRVALVQARPVSDPAKAQLLGGGVALMMLIVAAGLGALAVLVSGFTLLVIAMVKYASGGLRPRFERPAPGGSVYLETVSAFLAAFLLLQGLKFALELAFPGQPWMGPVSLSLQWIVLPIIAWPVVRGVPWERLRADMGWHSGRGAWREVGAGIVGYLAGVPIFLLGVVFSATAIFLREIIRQAVSGPGAAPPEPPTNPIIEVVESGSPVVLITLYLLAAVWAPIVEEAVFRGAFYRHLRARVPVLIAAAMSAAVFAALHGYDVLMLGPVFALGFNFALLREWRGSLIAPMTAHALHNGTLLAFVILLLNLLGR